MVSGDAPEEEFFGGGSEGGFVEGDEGGVGEEGEGDEEA